MDPGVLLGIGSAAAFGAGDFSGGFAARRLPALLVAAGAQLAGLLFLVAALWLLRPGIPAWSTLGLGAVAGLFGGLGLAALYRALSLGSMGLVTALSGVGSVAIPLVVGVMVLGQAITPAQWVGVGAAIGAGALGSGATRLGASREAFLLALVAATGFGMWFVFLDLAAEGNELWVLVASRMAAFGLAGTLVLATRSLARPRVASTWAIVALAGALDVGGNAAFVLSASALPVGVAAALAGLYPLVTMFLARGLLGERLPPLGLAAVVAAVAGIVLISMG